MNKVAYSYSAVDRITNPAALITNDVDDFMNLLLLGLTGSVFIGY